MSIFKRLFGDKEDSTNVSVQTFRPQNAHIKTLGSNFQKRFSRGVQYNMKVLIRGDRNVGKSALLNRLKGHDFVDQYIPTEEIEVACIHWSYKNAEDVVKVDVWDVVDKGRKKTTSGLKFENSGNNEDPPKSLCLDAEFLDVYKGAHGVILVLDMTKSWTFNYVEREMSKLPEHMPILVLANHRDMGHHRTVSADQVLSLLEPLPGYKKGLIKYWESSMKNGYGLVYIHRFFSIPFLMLQRDTLVRQLATNDSEMVSTQEDMEEFEEDPDNEYDSFVKSLKLTKCSSSPPPPPPPPPQKPVSLNVHSTPASQISSPTSPPSSHHGVHNKGSVTPLTEVARPPIHPPQAHPIPGMEKLGLYPLPVPVSVVDVVSKDCSVTDSTVPMPLPGQPCPDKKKKEIFDFVPDEQPELSMFFEESASPSTPANMKTESSSDEDNNGLRKPKRQNPMVATFQDDIDVEDVPPLDQVILSQQYDPSSSEDDQKNSHVISSKNTPERSEESSVLHVDVVKVPKKGILNEPNNHGYSEISFNANDLEILDQISSRKEIDTDEITINSINSDKPKKKKKHHHKQSETKDSSSKKKKKSSKKSEDVPHRDKPSKSVTNPNPHKSTKDGRDIDGDSSSDSLEKFLNE